MSEIILTNNPRRGDAALGVLGSNKVVFATNESMMSAALDTSKYEYLGPVLKRKGNDVLYAYHTNTGKVWCERYSFKLTGYTLDGAAHSGVLSIREASDSWAANHDYTVNYSASTVDEMVQWLNTFFLNTANPVFQTQDWYAQKESDDSITLHFAYTSWQQASYNTGKTGFTLTANLMPDVVALANIRRKNGAVGGEGVISSWERALAYFRNDNSSTTYNPSSDVTDVKRGYPICLPGYLGTSQYQSDHCAALRAIYGEGEAGWLKFMQSCLPVLPSDWGNMGIRDGKARTQVLASKTYVSHKKTTATPLCPAAFYCADIATSTQPKGTFHLPTTEEVYDILDGIKYGTNASRNADIVNALQNRMNKSAISNGSYLWSCCRNNALGAWFAGGFGGFFGGNSMYVSNTVVPVSHLILSDSED